VSRLRARCPDCRTLTAVAMGPDYQCHSCGREFGAGLVRVPQAWGLGGERMAAAAWLELSFPEAVVVDEETLAEQSFELASGLPERPLVLGGCCCAHVGAVEGLAQRAEALAVVWIDAHGDLNTPETSPSGNAWGMPLRMLIDGGSVAPERVALVGARSLDAAEQDFLRSSSVHIGEGSPERAVEGADAVYVALDCDVVEPGELEVFMPEPDGRSVDELEALLRRIAALRPVAGAGLTGLVGESANVPKLERLCAALGL
jgi:arginase